MATDNNTTTLREAVAVFHEAGPLKNAIRDLEASGYTHEDMGLLASEDTVRESLGDLYTCVNQDAEPSAASESFVYKSTGETGTSLGGSLYFVGTAGVAGGVVASAAVLGGALLTAASGVGAVGALVSGVIHQDEADYLHQQIDEGRLLLFVRTPDAESEKQVRDILSRHTDAGMRIVNVDASP